MYGSALRKSEAETGSADQPRAVDLLKAVWKNVISTPGSAREARTQFETDYGDALITYELEGLLMKQANAPVDIVVPRSTIFSEHPGVVIERNITPDERELVYAFRNFLWSEEAQKAFVRNNFRSSTDEALDAGNAAFVKIEDPFTVHYFGGWEKAYPEVIEKIFRDQVRVQ
jgi:ABC-type sulfate transport system substrate-binding protein